MTSTRFFSMWVNCDIITIFNGHITLFLGYFAYICSYKAFVSGFYETLHINHYSCTLSGGL